MSFWHRRVLRTRRRGQWKSRRPRPTGRRFLPRFERLESRAMLSAGVLVPGFGTGGLVTLDFLGAESSSAVSVIAPDGKLIVAGTVVVHDNGTNTDVAEYAVARLNKDGTLDSKFGTGGEVTIAFPNASQAGLTGATIDAGGKIVLAGNVGDGQTQWPGIARLNPNGSPDGKFGTGGEVVLSSSDFSVTSVAVNNQKIVLAGGTSTSFAVARLNDNGSLDGKFGAGGMTTVDFAGLDASAGSVAFQGDKLIVVGTAFSATDSEFAVTRLGTNGKLDKSFGTGGTVVFAFAGCNQNVATAVDVNGDKIAIAGYAVDAGTGQQSFAIAQLRKDGSLDNRFGANGRVTLAAGDMGIASANAVAFQNNKIVVAGYAYDESGSEFALARLNADGGLDGTFGDGGIVVTDIPAASGAAINSIAIQGNKIVVAGYAFDDSGFSFEIAKYTDQIRRSRGGHGPV
jgi:uncharacterized delta-60 repeat protein